MAISIKTALFTKPYTSSPDMDFGSFESLGGQNLWPPIHPRFLFSLFHPGWKLNLTLGNRFRVDNDALSGILPLKVYA